MINYVTFEKTSIIKMNSREGERVCVAWFPERM